MDRLPIPDRLVVMTFDDSVKSQFLRARPLLKRFGFGATFNITEGFTFLTDKSKYMTWDEIRQLHLDGFEIGNHTADHLSITDKSLPRLEEQLSRIDDRCRKYGIPKPISFAWPGNALSGRALEALREHGILFARRGGEPENEYGEGHGCAYEPTKDHPLLIPSAGDARPAWTLANLIRAVSQAKEGRIAVLQFHGVPESEHPWVDTPGERFEEYLYYLREHEYKVVAMRELVRYVDPSILPADPWVIVEERKRRQEARSQPAP